MLNTVVRKVPGFKQLGAWKLRCKLLTVNCLLQYRNWVEIHKITKGRNNDMSGSK